MRDQEFHDTFWSLRELIAGCRFLTMRHDDFWDREQSSSAIFR